MGEGGAGAVDVAADELYGLPLDRFTPRRAELAKAARAAGDKSAATEIGALRKPTVPAWLVNLLAREASDELGGLLELGEQLREAQSQLLGPRIKELSQQAHAAVQGLSRRVAELAESRDQAVTAAVDRDVEQTLRAALADPQAELAVASGRLTRALAYAGFGEVDVTAATATPLGRTTVRPGGGARAGSGAKDGRAADAAEATAPNAEGASERAGSAEAEAEVEAGVEPAASRLSSVDGRAAGGGRRDRTGSVRTDVLPEPSGGAGRESSATPGGAGVQRAGRGTKRGQAGTRRASDAADRAEAARADRAEAARADRAEAARAEDAAARERLEQATQEAQAAARAAREAEELVEDLQERLAQARRDAADAVRLEDTARRAERRAARAAREAASALRMATGSGP
jgi:hypothetical protein